MTTFVMPPRAKVDPTAVVLEGGAAERDAVEPTRQVISQAASKMKMRPVRWLYAGRIPAGGITLLAGREGIGKSTIGFDLAAQLTRGRLPGKYLGHPQNVGIIATEDSWEHVIVPRLSAAKADLERIYRLEVMDEGDVDTISAPADLARLREECEKQQIKLVLLDPIMSVIHGALDTHKDREVRKSLDPLSKFAIASGIAVLGLIHVNKSTTTDPLNSIMASRAFTAVARSVLYCIRDEEAEGEGQYLFGHPKCNLGPGQPTIGYRIVECKIELDPSEVEDDDEPIIVTSRVAWGDEDKRSIRDAMEKPAPRPKGELNTTIEEWVVGEGRVVARAELAEQFAEVKPATLDSTLSRMVKAGQLVRPFSGHYQAAPKKEG